MAWAPLTARTDPIADASLPAIRARSNPGTAIAAMMPMIATTISNSISVNPTSLFAFMMHRKPLPVAGWSVHPVPVHPVVLRLIDPSPLADEGGDVVAAESGADGEGHSDRGLDARILCPSGSWLHVSRLDAVA